MKPGSLPLRRTTLLLLAATLSLHAGRVRAQARPRIEPTDCPSGLDLATGSALDVELSNASPSARIALDEGALRCALVCDAAGVTAIVSRGDERVEQRIASLGPGLPRRLAIALAELIEASSTPDEPVAADAVETAEAIEASRVGEPADALEAPTTDPFRARLRLAGGLWLGGEPLLFLGALDLGAELAFTPNVALVLGVGGALGGIDVGTAQIDVRLLSAAVSARLGADVGPLWLGGGVAARGGAVFWTGHSATPGGAVGRDLTGGWLGLGAVAVVLLRVGELPLRIGVEIEGGGVAVYSAALVLGAPGARIDGGWLEARLAADLTLE